MLHRPSLTPPPGCDLMVTFDQEPIYRRAGATRSLTATFRAGIALSLPNHGECDFDVPVLEDELEDGSYAPIDPLQDAEYFRLAMSFVYRGAGREKVSAEAKRLGHLVEA